MAKTQQDFDDLIVRIDVATDTLEEAVAKVAEGEVNVDGSVQEAKDAAKESKDAATQAKASAQEAKQEAINSSNSSAMANASAVRAEAIKEELLQTVPYGDAPSNGVTYGRKNGEWQPVEAGGGGGTVGGVVTVNKQAPDDNGNVQLKYDDLDNLPPLFSGSYEDLTNKPTIPTVDVKEAPKDGKQYARKDGGWSEVESTGGGGGASGGWVNKNPNSVKYSKALVENPQLLLGGEGSSITPDEAKELIKWDTDLSTPPTTNPFEYVDLMALQIKRNGEVVLGSDEVVEDYNPIVGEFTWLLRGSADGVLLNTSVSKGEHSDYIRESLPAGRWLIREGLRFTGSDMKLIGLKEAFSGGTFLLDIVDLVTNDKLPPEVTATPLREYRLRVLPKKSKNTNESHNGAYYFFNTTKGVGLWTETTPNKVS